MLQVLHVEAAPTYPNTQQINLLPYGMEQEHLVRLSLYPLLSPTSRVGVASSRLTQTSVSRGGLESGNLPRILHPE